MDTPMDFLFGYLMMLPMSRRYSGEVDGMRIGKENRSTQQNPAHCHFVHHKSHMT
jgi:hypothetical protein